MSRRVFNVEQIRTWIVNDSLSMSEVARRLESKPSVISKLCKRHNIKSSHVATPKLELPIKEIYDRYTINKDSLDLLKKEYNTPIPTLRRHLLNYDQNLHIRTMDEAKRPALLNDKDALENELKSKSCVKIASELGVKIATVTNAVKKFGLKTHGVVYDDINFDVLYDLYVVRKLYPRDIAKTLNLKYGVVLRQLKKQGFTINKQGGYSKGSKYPQLNDYNWLHTKYIVEDLSIGSIADIVGTTVGNVVYHLKKHEIRLKTREEYLQSLRSQHGNKGTYKDVKVDSKLETKFLQTLTDDQIKSLKRDVMFENGRLCCFIDFKVDDDYIEIKSRENSSIPGVERRRLIKQFKICENNGVNLKVWNNKYIDISITDDDIYYAVDWKLFFDSYTDCYDWLLDFGFHGVSYPKSDLTDGLRNVLRVKDELNAASRNDDALKLIKHFSQHYWWSRRDGYNSIASVWDKGNNNILRDAIKQLWDNNKEINLYGLVKLIPKLYKDFMNVSIFKPWVARAVYDIVIPNGGIVFDPCMGWGGRLLGTVDSNIEYIGMDINSLSVDSNLNLQRFSNSRLCSNNTFMVGDCTSDEFPEADLLFTSPPYGSEVYHGSCNSEFSDIICSLFSKFNNTIALNVPSSFSELTVNIGSRFGYSLVNKIDMKTIAPIRREKSFEPILVFSK